MVRFKNRYVLFEIHVENSHGLCLGDSSLNERLISKILKDNFLACFGEYNFGCVLQSLQLKYYNTSTGVRCFLASIDALMILFYFYFLYLFNVSYPQFIHLVGNRSYRKGIRILAHFQSNILDCYPTTSLPNSNSATIGYPLQLSESRYSLLQRPKGVSPANPVGKSLSTNGSGYLIFARLKIPYSCVSSIFLLFLKKTGLKTANRPLFAFVCLFSCIYSNIYME
eukprot:Sdes_comp19174_c0_seq1m9966